MKWIKARQRTPDKTFTKRTRWVDSDGNVLADVGQPPSVSAWVLKDINYFLEWESDESLLEDAKQILSKYTHGMDLEEILIGAILIAMEEYKNQDRGASAEAGREESFLETLQHNWQVQIAKFYNEDKTDSDKAKRQAVIDEYTSLIGLYKQKFHLK